MLNKKAVAVGLSVAVLGAATVYFGYDNYHTNKELNNMCLYFQGTCECTNSMKHTET